VKHKHDVFLSFSHADRETAAQISDALKALGVEAWNDANVPACNDWGDHLREAMKKADAVVLLMTPASLASAYVMSEIGAAVAAHKPVIPVVPANGRVPRGLPTPLRAWPLIRAGSRGVGEVAAEIRERLEHMPVPESA